ncbi:MAG TPA: type VI secretion system tip protein VgrG [Cytophagaceae bacterium]|nr:type VI secretion system tip protein VgrG [Cytophagaceae bacterium]
MGLSLVIPGTDKGGVVTYTILSDGKTMPATISVSSIVTGKEANKIPYARLVLFDGEVAHASSKPNFELSSGNDFKPGKKITIKAGYSSKEKTIFEGVVVKQSVKHRSGKTSLLEVEIRDEAVKLTVGRKNKFFNNKLDSAIISSLLSGVKGVIEPTLLLHKQVIQYFSTDWDFILSRAEMNSKVVLVNDGKVSVKSPSLLGLPVLSLQYGVNVLEFDAEMDARTQFKSIVAQAYDGAKNDSVKDKGKVIPPLVGGQGNISSDELSKVIGLDQYLIQHGGNRTKPELKAAADGKAIKAAFSKVRGSVKIEGTASVKPGDIVSFTGIGTRFSGNAYVSGVMHDISRGYWSTTIQFGLSFDWFGEENKINDVPAAAMVPAVRGLLIGIVAPFEQDPESNQRIKVTIPVVDRNETVWARVGVFEAGTDHGFVFNPYEGDEVIIGFLNDDPRDPIILGSLYSKKNKPFIPASSTNTKKGITTKKKLQLTFDDEKKVIEIKTPGGNMITISDDKKGITIVDQNKNTIATSDKGITIDCAKDIKISAKGDISLEGKNVSLKAQSSFSADGQSEAKVNSGSQTVIKGGIVKIN